MIYKEYARRRPDDCLRPESRFYLHPLKKPHCSGKWFSREPIGKNTIARFAKTLAQQAEFTGKRTNRSAHIAPLLIKNSALLQEHSHLSCPSNMMAECHYSTDDSAASACSSLQLTYPAVKCGSQCGLLSDDAMEVDASVKDEDSPNSDSAYIVYHTQLMELFQFCPECGSAIIEKECSQLGAILTVTYSCLNSCKGKWSSQP